MNHWIRHIIVRLAGIVFLAVLALTAVKAQKPVPHIEIPQCYSYTFSVVEWPGDRYTWDLYRDSTVNFAWEKGDVDPAAYFENQMYEGSSVTVNWLDTGRYFLRVMVWDEVNCTNNLLVFSIDVLPNLPTVVLEGDSVCQDEIAYVKVVFTGMAPWSAKYTFDDGNVVLNLNGETDEEFFVPMQGLPVGTREYWVMEVTDQCTVNSYPVPNPEKARVVIFPRPVSKKIYLNE